MEVLEESQKIQAQGKDIISFSIGEPDFATPKPVVEALQKALREGNTYYTHSQGLLELREAIAEHYETRYQVKLNPEQIFVTSGSSPALLLALSVLLNPGEEVLLPEPYYPCYPNFLKYLSAKINYLPLDPQKGFRIEPKKLAQEINRKTKALLFGSPANPTGQVLTREELQAIANLPTQLVVDEVYHGLSDTKEASILEFTDEAFVINSFSKAYAMTGWRLGFLIAPLAYTNLLKKLAQNLFICTTTFVQKAGIAALKETKEERAAMVKELKARREVMVSGLEKLGFPIPVKPQGAFYILTESSKFSPDSLQFCSQLLKHAQVGITPGADFCRKGEGLVRFSYTVSRERIAEGLGRIASLLEKIDD